MATKGMKILSHSSLLWSGTSGQWSILPVPAIILLLIAWSSAVAQQPAKFIRKGNSEYNDAKFKDAEINYRKALDKSPQSVKATYNLGDALYKQGDYEKAASSFSNVTGQKSLGDKSKAAAFHNLGNSMLQEKKYGESIEAYKNALRLNPKDEETRYNLAYAMTKLQQQNNKNNQDKNKDQKQQQQKQQQQKQDEQKQQQQQQQPQNKQMKKQDAERMLQALNNNEKQTLDKVKKNKAKAVQVRTEKDW